MLRVRRHNEASLSDIRLLILYSPSRLVLFCQLLCSPLCNLSSATSTIPPLLLAPLLLVSIVFSVACPDLTPSLNLSFHSQCIHLRVQHLPSLLVCSRRFHDPSSSLHDFVRPAKSVYRSLACRISPSYIIKRLPTSTTYGTPEQQRQGFALVAT